MCSPFFARLLTVRTLNFRRGPFMGDGGPKGFRASLPWAVQGEYVGVKAAAETDTVWPSFRTSLEQTHVPLQRGREMRVEGHFCGVCVPCFAGVDDLYMFFQRSNGQRRRQAAI